MVRQNRLRWVTLDVLATWVKQMQDDGKGGHVIAMSEDAEGNGYALLEPNAGFWGDEVIEVDGDRVQAFVLWPGGPVEVVMEA